MITGKYKVERVLGRVARRSRSRCATSSSVNTCLVHLHPSVACNSTRSHASSRARARRSSRASTRRAPSTPVASNRASLAMVR